VCVCADFPHARALTDAEMEFLYLRRDEENVAYMYVLLHLVGTKLFCFHRLCLLSARKQVCYDALIQPRQESVSSK